MVRLCVTLHSPFRVLTSKPVLYPTMVAALFTTSITKVGLLSVAIGGGVGLGQFGASLVATPGGMLRWKIFAAVVICTATTAALAGATKEATASGLAVVASICIGALESFAGVAVTIVIKDQTEIGTAAGVYGSIRSVGGVLATAILTTVLQGRVKSETAHHVVPALLTAGLPATSLEDFLVDLGAGDVTAAKKLPGVTVKVLEVAAVTLRNAYQKSFETVYLVTLAFGIISCIAAFFSPSIESLYTDEVMRQLHPAGGKRAQGVESDTEQGYVEKHAVQVVEK